MASIEEKINDSQISSIMLISQYRSLYYSALVTERCITKVNLTRHHSTVILVLAKFNFTTMEFSSKLNLVWDFWTQDEHIVNWNFVSNEWCCPSAENDLTPNGNFSSRMEAKDGSFGFDFTGEYKNVINSELITYKIADGRLVKINFSKSGNEVILRETFDAEGTNSDEQQRSGWKQFWKISKSL